MSWTVLAAWSLLGPVVLLTLVALMYWLGILRSKS
jgi:hypothetical protein